MAVGGAEQAPAGALGMAMGRGFHRAKAARMSWEGRCVKKHQEVVRVLRAHESGNWERRAVGTSGELPLEEVLQAARVILQDPQQQRQRAKRSYQKAKATMDKEVKQGQKKREVRAGKEQNGTGHLKQELILQVSPSLFSHSYTTAESRSTCQCWVASYFMMHKLREVQPKRQSIYNSLAQCRLKATLTTKLKGT